MKSGRAFLVALVGVGSSLSGSVSSSLAALGVQVVPASLIAERANASAPTMKDNLQQRQGAQAESLKQYFRGGGHVGWRGWSYPGKPTTVAAEKRKAQKRRNRLRHKARTRSK